MKGRIIKAIAGFYYVDVDGPVYECRARGVLRNKRIKPLVGDVAEIEVLDAATKKGNLLTIEKRRNSLIRPTIANVDQAIVVFAVTKPVPNLNLLDRFLVISEARKISSIIVLSKSDLLVDISEIKNIYSKYYKVVDISVKEEIGLRELKNLISGKVNVLAGPSGVGKSTLTNCLVPQANMETNEISTKIERGKQTTRHAELFEVEKNTYICDTPGFASLELFDIDKNTLKNFFPEFSTCICKFNSCNHISEIDCGVKTAVSTSIISKSRYENYCLFYEELEKRRGY